MGPDAQLEPTRGEDLDAVIAHAADVLRQRGERMTGPRRAILTVLAERGEHLSAEDVVGRVEAIDPRVHRSSVYRTLDALSAAGLVEHVHLGQSGTAYHLSDGDRAHLHARCHGCGEVVDLPPDLLDPVVGRVRLSIGFAVDPTHVALSGLCAACAGSQVPESTAG